MKGGDINNCTKAEQRGLLSNVLDLCLLLIDMSREKGKDRFNLEVSNYDLLGG
ncbi:MAG: hypothetical protein GX333_09335 [Syntrophomonadaceae bacterium]|nr:hypothetical protein [Syntrophomonadaceae bacterium]